MKRIHIIGRKNHGKTTLVAELVQELSTRGYRVGTIKHTHHQHELDTPGKDSHRHGEAGAAVVGILTRSMNPVFWKAAEDSSAEDRYQAFAQTFADCQITLVEGDTQTTSPKIEVWRKSRDTEPLAKADVSIQAIVTHGRGPRSRTPVLPRSNVAVVAKNILALVGIE